MKTIYSTIVLLLLWSHFNVSPVFLVFCFNSEGYLTIIIMKPIFSRKRCVVWKTITLIHKLIRLIVPCRTLLKNLTWNTDLVTFSNLCSREFHTLVKSVFFLTRRNCPLTDLFTSPVTHVWRTWRVVRSPFRAVKPNLLLPLSALTCFTWRISLTCLTSGRGGNGGCRHMYLF